MWLHGQYKAKLRAQPQRSPYRAIALGPLPILTLLFEKGDKLTVPGISNLVVVHKSQMYNAAPT
jgi:hypothetical protein